MAEALNRDMKSVPNLQPHIMCGKGDIARNVLICGDPARAKKIAKMLEDAREVSSNREYLIFTGTYCGVPVSVCSTGIGAPSTAIGMEELGNVGAKVFIRVGSAGGLQEYVNPGDLVIATAAWRGDGTSKAYVEEGFPAVADLEVTNALIRASADSSARVHVGLISSGDAFYAPKPPGRVQLFQRCYVLAGEMECSLVFVLAKLRGWKAGAVLAIDGNIVRKERKRAIGTETFEAAEREAIKVALEAVHELASSVEVSR